MKFIFNPKNELTEQETKILGDFSRAIDDACNSAKCSECVLQNLCHEYTDAPVYLTKLFETLGIY